VAESLRTNSNCSVVYHQQNELLCRTGPETAAL